MGGASGVGGRAGEAGGGASGAEGRAEGGQGSSFYGGQRGENQETSSRRGLFCYCFLFKSFF